MAIDRECFRKKQRDSPAREDCVPGENKLQLAYFFAFFPSSSSDYLLAAKLQIHQWYLKDITFTQGMGRVEQTKTYRA